MYVVHCSSVLNTWCNCWSRDPHHADGPDALRVGPVALRVGAAVVENEVGAQVPGAEKGGGKESKSRGKFKPAVLLSGFMVLLPL